MTTRQTPDSVREADPRVEIAAKALGLHRNPGGNRPPNSPTRWPTAPQDTLSGRDGTVPLTWDFAQQCRAEVRAILAALDRRAGDAGEGWKLVPVEMTREMSDAGRDATGGYPYAPHDIPKLGYMQVNIIWNAILAATPAPAVDAVPAGEVMTLPHVIEQAKQNLALTQGCMECNAADERRWQETITWLEGLA